jgi:hypothetical protein
MVLALTSASPGSAQEASKSGTASTTAGGIMPRHPTQPRRLFDSGAALLRVD